MLNKDNAHILVNRHGGDFTMLMVSSGLCPKCSSNKITNHGHTSGAISMTLLQSCRDCETSFDVEYMATAVKVHPVLAVK